MLRTFLIVGVLAFGAGTLFRLSRQLEIPALQMFGFWSLVAIGLILARSVRQQQAVEARREVARVLVALGKRSYGKGSSVVASDGRLPLAGGPEPDRMYWAADQALIVGPGGVLALRLDEMADYGRGARAGRRLAAAQERAQRWAAAVRRTLAGMGEGEPVPVYPCLVLLRRRAPEAGTAEPNPEQVMVLNPDRLADLLAFLGKRSSLDEARREEAMQKLHVMI